MLYKTKLSIFLSLLLLISCTDDSDFENPEGIFIRVENSSGIDFKDILVNSGSGEVEFGGVKAGKRSSYKEFESAFRYGFVRLMAGNKDARYQPYDYVGETPLVNGYYTYKLGLDNSAPDNPYLTLELIVD